MNSNIAIHPLTSKYIDDVFEINNLSFRTPWSKESITKEIEDNSCARYVVAIKDDIVIGYGGIWLILDEAHMTNIAVHPSYRTCGTGSMLLNGLFAICKAENILAMTLEVRATNLKAQSMYTKFGFIEAGRRKHYYSDTNEDAIIMWKYDIC